MCLTKILFHVMQYWSNLQLKLTEASLTDKLNMYGATRH